MNRLYGGLAATLMMLSPVIGYADALPIGCDDPASTGFDLVDCGDHIGTVAGSDGGGPIDILETSYDQIAKWDPNDGGFWDGEDPGTGWSVTGTPGTWGEWTSAFDILFIVIKASNNYSVYGQGATGASSGFWATAPTLLGGGGNGRNLSHLSFYGRGSGDGGDGGSGDGGSGDGGSGDGGSGDGGSGDGGSGDGGSGDGGTPVPEPGTLALLGLGLAGMGLSRRRRKD